MIVLYMDCMDDSRHSIMIRWLQGYVMVFCCLAKEYQHLAGCLGLCFTPTALMEISLTGIFFKIIRIIVRVQVIVQAKNPNNSQIYFESARETRRLLAFMCIGFLANHRLFKHPQNQLVLVYQCLFTTFQILFLCT